jgi:glycosyltransferase involved in cell wall biosynthesis
MFPRMPLISISDHQRTPMPRSSNWMKTIHHGLPTNVCAFHREQGNYLAFLGRIAPEKRPDRAIEIAKRVGIPLKLAAKVDPVDQQYFDHVIKPQLEHPLIEFVGEIGEAQKGDFLGNAIALLFPIDWPEPFGLVMIEAMSTGTPVIAWANGSVPEVLDEGVTGCVVNSLEAAAAAVDGVLGLSRSGVRRQFESRFTASEMARNYVGVYERLMGDRLPRANSGISKQSSEPLSGPILVPTNALVPTNDLIRTGV